jgi:hypothetical protein
MDALLAALITEGEAIYKESEAARVSGGSTALHIDQVTDWLDRSTQYISTIEPTLASQIPVCKPTDPFQTIFSTIFRILTILKSLAAPRAPIASTAQPQAARNPPHEPPSEAASPKSLEEWFLYLLLPKNRVLRTVSLCILGLILLVVFAWSLLPEKTKDAILEKHLFAEHAPSQESGRLDAQSVKSEALTAEPGKPSAPSIRSVVSKGGSIVVKFDAPADGGSPITGYSATAVNTDSTQKQKPLTGMSNGTQLFIDIAHCTAADEYTVTLVANNKNGSSAAGKASSTVKCNAAATNVPATPIPN